MDLQKQRRNVDSGFVQSCRCMVFMGVASLLKGKTRGLFSVQIQASKHHVGSSPLVLKDKKAASHKVKGSLYSCLLIAALSVRK